MIDRWNERVKLDVDLVYHCGDFSFLRGPRLEYILTQLRGRIILIKGNHDKSRHLKLLTPRCEAVYEHAHELEILGKWIVASHCPFLSWNRSQYGSINVHGHTHSHIAVRDHPRRVNVGVDAWDFYPVHVEEVFELCKKMEKELKKG